MPQGENPLLFVKTFPINKLYTDDTGRFPIRAQSGNQYVVIVYHEEGNLILQQPFKSKNDVHRIAAYNAIMTYWLPDRALMGKRSVSSVYSLLIGYVVT